MNEEQTGIPKYLIDNPFSLKEILGGEATEDAVRDDIVKFLKEHGVDIDDEAIKELSDTPLHFSAPEEKYKSIEQLLTGNHKERTEEIGLPPLHLAAQTGREEMVKMLLNYGANINPQDSDASLAQVREIGEADTTGDLS